MWISKIILTGLTMRLSASFHDIGGKFFPLPPINKQQKERQKGLKQKYFFELVGSVPEGSPKGICAWPFLV